jgi:glycosyltransferase involved in cell wall biosynthesis
MKKILIVVNPMLTGIEYHRQLIPHYYLNEQEDYEVSQINEIDTATDDFLKDFHLVQFSRMASFKGEHSELLNRLRRLGIVTVVDVDDFWRLPKTHFKYYQFKVEHVSEQVEETLTYTDMVTCPTQQLADIVRLFNPNVHVIPNAINPDQPQFEVKRTVKEKVRFGLVPGASHLQDIRLMTHSFYLLNTSPFLKGRYQTYLMGFNTDDRLGIYKSYEDILTGGLMINDDTYYRIPGVDVYNYAQGYNLFDVALVPLDNTPFNSCKSELKLIEAGFMKKAVIVSDVLPYSPIIADGENCLTVGANMNYKDWFKQMQAVIKEPSMINDLAEQLYETVKEKYHIATANAVRMQLYEELINRGTAYLNYK